MQRTPFKEQTIDYVDYYVVQSSDRTVDLDLRSWKRTGFSHAASGSLTVFRNGNRRVTEPGDFLW